MSLFPVGMERDAYAFLYDFWDTLSTQEIYKNWPEGIVLAFFEEYGLFSTEPLEELIARTIAPGLKRRFSLAAVNADTARYDRFNETLSVQEIKEAARGSAAVPVVFPHVHVGDFDYIDGGIISTYDIGGVVERCRDDGFQDEDIVVDVVLCQALSLEEKNITGESTSGVFSRYYEVMNYVISMHNYYDSRLDYPDVLFRYTVYPESKLPQGTIPLSFDHDKIMECIEIGYKDAEKVILEKVDASGQRLLGHIQSLMENWFPHF